MAHDLNAGRPVANEPCRSVPALRLRFRSCPLMRWTRQLRCPSCFGPCLVTAHPASPLENPVPCKRKRPRQQRGLFLREAKGREPPLPSDHSPLCLSFCSFRGSRAELSMLYPHIHFHVVRSQAPLRALPRARLIALTCHPAHVLTCFRLRELQQLHATQAGLSPPG